MPIFAPDQAGNEYIYSGADESKTKDQANDFHLKAGCRLDIPDIPDSCFVFNDLVVGGNDFSGFSPGVFAVRGRCNHGLNSLLVFGERYQVDFK